MTEAEIRGHEQANRRAAADLADPRRLRLLVARLQMQIAKPPTFPADSPDRIDRMLAEHEKQSAGVLATMATILEACAARIEELEHATRTPGAGT